MASYGIKSEEMLSTVDSRLVEVLRHALNYGIADWSIIKGHRGEVEQNEAFNSGNSKVKWPNSNHNYSPSMAIDFTPYPFRGWDVLTDFVFVAAVILAAAKELNIPVRWGGNWNMNNMIMEDANWEKDLGHIERI